MTDAKRELVFLVADQGMQQILEGFFLHDRFEHRIGCARFDINPRLNKDVFVASGGNDPGLCRRAHELLLPHQRNYRRAVVMVDNAWDGSPGPEGIRAEIRTGLMNTGWEHVEVIVLDPELEVWLWQESNPNLATALGYRSSTAYREVLRDAGLWADGCPKPAHPKKARVHLAKQKLIDPSNAVFKRAAGTVAVKGCQDAAFRRLCATLRDWFPTEEQERAR